MGIRGLPTTDCRLPRSCFKSLCFLLQQGLFVMRVTPVSPDCEARGRLLGARRRGASSVAGDETPGLAPPTPPPAPLSPPAGRGERGHRRYSSAHGGTGLRGRRFRGRCSRLLTSRPCRAESWIADSASLAVFRSLPSAGGFRESNAFCQVLKQLLVR
jgi:hypothetical protein